ncbi:MAG TPA: leucyl/phenylalanyl-tRNA--protein transferase [Acidimicrobiales bacterium]|nr:leucyl/phenylalanyl-tRNA--protein transferase [Acidimicrobiales bacterium]
METQERTGPAPAPRRLARSAWVLPEPGTADDEGSGLVAFGADLAPETIVDAYRRGIFPWPHEGSPLPWFSPDPRGVLHVRVGAVVSKSLRQRLRRSGWTTTVDAAFDEVVAACADRVAGEGTWIVPEMRRAYGDLHRLGWAHSLEVWDGDQLVGGLYGVRVGGCFTGESMFHRAPDASKVAFVDLVARWRGAGGAVIDVQIPTDHLVRLGVVDMDRADFLAWMARLRDDPVNIVRDRLPVSRLVSPPASGPGPGPGAG